MSAKSSLNEETRCTHLTAGGRRCQMPFAPNHTSLCAHHALQDLQLHNSKLVTEEILGPLGDFRSAFAINRALGKLFTVTAENRIPVRNAAVLAYISQLLLQTLHPLRGEALETGGQGRMDAIVNDTVIRLGNELPPIPFGPNDPRCKPMSVQVAESLETLRRAGFNLPAELMPKPDDSGDEDSEEEEEEKSKDDGGNTDDENEDEVANENSGSHLPSA